MSNHKRRTQRAMLSIALRGGRNKLDPTFPYLPSRKQCQPILEAYKPWELKSGQSCSHVHLGVLCSAYHSPAHSWVSLSITNHCLEISNSHSCLLVAFRFLGEDEGLETIAAWMPSHKGVSAPVRIRATRNLAWGLGKNSLKRRKSGVSTMGQSTVLSLHNYLSREKGERGAVTQSTEGL